jgi:hypothetical protein
MSLIEITPPPPPLGDQQRAPQFGNLWSRYRGVEEKNHRIWRVARRQSLYLMILI